MVDLAIAEAAAKKILDIQAEVAQLNERIEDLKRIVASNVPEGQTETRIGNVKAIVYLGKKYDETYGKQNAPDLWDKYAVTTRVLTSAEAKKRLSGEDYEKFQKPNSKPTVKIESVDD